MNKKLAVGPDLKSSTLVESIIKRKGGTVVPFGHGHHKQVNYHFKPTDSSSPDSAHVCDVPDDVHRHQLLAIKDGYRLYNQHEEQFEDDQDEDDDQDDNNQGGDVVDYEDMLGLNADAVSTDFLKKYAKDHLKISSTSKATAQEYAKSNYDIDLEGTMTVISMLREIMKAEQAEQLKQSEAHKLANS